MKQGTILGSQIGKWIILAVVVAAFAALLTVSVVRAQDDSTTIEYAENGKDAVATFTATDPEGVTPITWSVPDDLVAANIEAIEDGDDADNEHFMIDKDGMLKFNIGEANDGSSPGSPDFENGQGGDTENPNTYKVVVVACDVMAEDCADGVRGYHKVTVKVTNVDETGKVTWTVDPDGAGGDGPDDFNGGSPIVQFQFGAVLTVPATSGVTDGDVSGPNKNVDERWQWYRSPSKTATGTAIDAETSSSYTVTTEDVGKYIRVEAFYNISEAAREESASRTSDYPVLGSRSNNKAPEFDPATITREVSEGKKGMTVGAPVRATDDTTNALSYSLSGADAARFKIDEKTGRITTAVDLDREGTSVAVEGTLGSCADAAEQNPDPECTVTVTATDSAGASAEATVTINITNMDEKPKFTTEGAALSPMTIMSPENSTALFAVGRGAGFVTTEPGVTYAATDEDGLNVTWSLMGADRAKFQLSGSQVLSFKAKPNYEMPGDANRDNVYEVTVRVRDGTMYADRMVRVTVTEVNEGPEIMGKPSVEYAENGKDAVATFTATDPEGVTPITWSVPDDLVAANIEAIEDGDDADNEHFMIDKDGMLKFNIGEANDGSSPGSPDFENGQGGDTENPNTYKVVVVACDVMAEDCADGVRGYHKVTVKVTNVDETGKVTWTVDPDGAGGDGPDDFNGGSPIVQFQFGAVLTVPATSGVTDGDVSGPNKNVDETWQWYRSPSKTATGTAIDAETSSSYTVTTEDVDKYIRVVASYNIGSGPTVDASRTSDYPVLESRSNNKAPEFDPATITREVSEGKKGMPVGALVRATDDTTNALSYSLSGADAARFKIDEKTGRITTAVDLDREGTSVAVEGTLGSCADAAEQNPDPECTVTVTATDSAGASAEATVTINITNKDEKPKFTTEGAALSPMTIMSPENSTALFAVGRGAGFVTTEPGVTYAATDEDGLNVNLALMGPDEDKFSLGTGGVLSFKAKPNYEMPADANKDNVYEVTVRASDGTMYADRMVKVTVTEVNEAPMILGVGLSISGASSVYFSEGEKDAEAMFKASGPMQDMARWTLEGADRMYFSVGTTRGAMTELMFRSAPDYEMPRGRAMSDTNTNTYMVTLKANDGTHMDTHDVTVMVTNVDELGVLTADMDSPISYMERGTMTVATYMADGPMADTATWTTMGADADDFTITGGMLKFKMAPDYEDPMGGADDDSNTYMVTVKAEAGGEMEMMDAEVMVTNVEEDGTVTLELSRPTLSVGTQITAMLEDDDMVTTVSWQWARDDARDGTFTDMISGETSNTYTAAADDEGKYLRTTAMYTDGYDSGNEEMATTTSAVVSNRAPMFAAATATRTIAENSEAGAAVGGPVTATDADSGDTLAYTLSGDDDMYFTIDNMGQIMVGMDTMLDYEAEKSTYMVTVTATDDSDAHNNSASIAVTINVTDVNEAPMFETDMATREVAENTAAGMNVGAPVTATDADTDDTLTYALSGDDAMYFSIDTSTGQIMVGHHGPRGGDTITGLTTPTESASSRPTTSWSGGGTRLTATH